MYYEFRIEDGWKYYALIKAKGKAQAYEVYNDNICSIKDFQNRLLPLPIKKALNIYNEKNRENRIATLKEFEEDEAPLIVLLDFRLTETENK